MNLLSGIRKNPFTMKALAMFIVISLLNELVFPLTAFALTGGPSQPEVQSFEPVGTSDMVDLFSGDFNYNIPLLDVGGYPINLSYHSGVSMDQEASWVGLGWNINPGVINRNMRSVPDDFNGEQVMREFNIKKNETYGARLSANWEALGLDGLLSLGASLGINYNNYKGVSSSFSISPELELGKLYGSDATLSLGISSSSEGGAGISPSLGLTGYKKGEKLESGIGLNMNTRAGLQSLTISRTKDPIPNTRNESEISFATPTYVPQVDKPFQNSALSIKAKTGIAIFGNHPNTQISGSYSEQHLSTNIDPLPAFGYLYAHNGQALSKVMMDFNREKDGSFTPNTPNLPVTNFSYDIYSVSGQGIGGCYRPHRSDVGVLFDSEVSNIGGNVNFPPIEVGAGNTSHTGINTSASICNTVSGKWTQNNGLEGIVKFRGNIPGLELYEPFYFKQVGEKVTESDIELFNELGGNKAVKIDIQDGSNGVSGMAFPGNHMALANLTDGTNHYPIQRAFRKNRAKRNEVVDVQTAYELSNLYTKSGKGKYYSKLSNYTMNDFTYTNGQFPFTYIDRINQHRKPHHVSQISAYRSDGARYIYAIPAYNYKEENVTFAVQSETVDCAKGLVTYNHGKDNSLLNDNGLDNYFDKTVMPAYAHSYLLTAIVSADYVDRTGDGPTDDDYGTYTKFNYTLAQSEDSPPYKWRVPYEKGKASYNEGMKSHPMRDKDADDKGSYIYGEKELWYLHSIETRTHVAQFYLQPRDDAFGAASDEGGYENNKSAPSYCIQKIVLHAKQDKIKSVNPEPLKTVHFEYNYSLCPGLPNNKNTTPSNPLGSNTGKLTLTKLYFTYGSSLKGELSPYEFNYAQTFNSQPAIHNPSYNIKGYDRWGNFKANDDNNACSPFGNLTTSEFPYTPQDKYPGSNPLSNDFESLADLNAMAWTLTSVTLPSGGVIKVKYEADDYAFVQDKRAMQMFTVEGTSKDKPNTSADGIARLFYHGQPHDPYNYITVKLSEAIETTTNATYDNNRFKKKYLQDFNGNQMQYMYFRFMVNLKSGHYEYVPGYAKILDGGLIGSGTAGSSQYGWVLVDSEDARDGGSTPVLSNPVSLAAWNFTKMHLPQLAYDQPNVNSPSIMQVITSLAGALESLREIFNSYYAEMRGEKNGWEYIPAKSLVRLYNPDGKKQGGGARVKKITISDQWNTMTGTHDNFEYGQEYTYTTTGADGSEISSGVASYEPSVGGEENPFRQPIFYSEEKKCALDDRYMQETPYGESFFPGASVGYSKVTVRNLKRTNVTKNATGKTVHEFYTAKDFPTRTESTTITPLRHFPPAVLEILISQSYDYMTVSQGHLIELNDMHGKPKANWVYAEDNNKDPLSGVEYKYKLNNLSGLDNTFKVIGKDGVIKEEPLVGVEYDVTVDMREHETTTEGGGLNTNLETFVVGIIPLAIPIVLPVRIHETRKFRSVVVTKVINKSGILEETIAHDLGASVSSKNLLLDKETGEVLLTQTYNQFEDPVYAFTYPAHWAYPQMGPTYQTIGYALQASNNLGIQKAPSILTPGDELLVKFKQGDIGRAWVIEDNSSIGLKLIDYQGERIALSGIEGIRLLRPASRNQQSMPIGSVTTLRDPLVKFQDGNAEKYTLFFDKVISAEAIEYSDKWNTLCECGIEKDKIYNPFLIGIRGLWHKKRSYLYLTDRQQTRQNNNLDVRRDGVFTTFAPYWKPTPSGVWTTTGVAKWQYTADVTEFSPFGFELENKDPLDRASSATYGYSNQLPMSVSANARYRDVGFDNFEDYDFNACLDDHFSYKLPYSQANHTNISIDQQNSHTGRRSIKIKPNNSIRVTKPIDPCP